MEIEEMKKAVIAYCEEIDKEGIRLQMMHQGFTHIRKVGSVWTVAIGGKIYYLDEGFEGWEFLYAALGLEARDAVEGLRIDRRKEFMNEVDAKIAELREESDKYFTELQAERARNAKLVEALNQISKWDGELDYEWGGYKNRASMALQSNTEKGGSNE